MNLSNRTTRLSEEQLALGCALQDMGKAGRFLKKHGSIVGTGGRSSGEMKPGEFLDEHRIGTRLTSFTD